ncbi:hypothetical protein C8Q78DRAFT_346012 [Trametes maxima]|nr:hypothetical protein C8Q78DRAFT_346012 [Trametes maxima]
MVALDLYSLVVYTPAQSLRKVVHFPVLQCPLPALREATFIDLCDPGPLIAHSTDTRPLLPSLTHLHLVIGASELALNQWAAHGPCVTHLRVTGVADSKQVHPLASAVGVRADLGRFSRALQGSLDPPQTVHGSEFPSRTYPSLKFLLMQPRPTTNGGWCGYNAIDRSRMVFGLQQIEDGCREKWGSEPEVTSILLQELSKNAFREKNTSGIQRQWRNRVEGGEGCWIGLT